MEIRKKFIDNHIDYDDLDKELIPLLHVLNFKLNLKTTHSCFGHRKDEQIMTVFDKHVSDTLIVSISKYLSKEKFWMFKFNKWIRPVHSGWILMNWVFESSYCKDRKSKIEYLDRLVKLLENYKDDIYI